MQPQPEAQFTIGELISIAQISIPRNKELATRLGCYSDMIPRYAAGASLPRGDVLLRLLEITGVEPNAVALDGEEAELGEPHPLAADVAASASFDEADEAALQLFEEGAYHPGALEVIEQLILRASNNDQRCERRSKV